MVIVLPIYVLEWYRAPCNPTPPPLLYVVYSSVTGSALLILITLLCQVFRKASVCNSIVLFVHLHSSFPCSF